MKLLSNSSWDKDVYIIGPREVVGSFTETAIFFRTLFGNNFSKIHNNKLTLKEPNILLVLLLRIGFILIQMGSIPTQNVCNILFQNIIDIGVSITSYGFLGFMLNFGAKSLEGVVGHGSWIDSDMNLISLHQAGYGMYHQFVDNVT